MSDRECFIIPAEELTLAQLFHAFARKFRSIRCPVCNVPAEADCVGSPGRQREKFLSVSGHRARLTLLRHDEAVRPQTHNVPLLSLSEWARMRKVEVDAFLLLEKLADHIEDVELAAELSVLAARIKGDWHGRVRVRCAQPIVDDGPRIQFADDEVPS